MLASDRTKYFYYSIYRRDGYKPEFKTDGLWLLRCTEEEEYKLIAFLSWTPESNLWLYHKWSCVLNHSHSTVLQSHIPREHRRLLVEPEYSAGQDHEAWDYYYTPKEVEHIFFIRTPDISKSNGLERYR